MPDQNEMPTDNPGAAEMPLPAAGPMINLGEVSRTANLDQFWEIRGKAVQGYASLEQSLSRLFAALAGTDNETTGIVFFTLSANVRNKIFKKLLAHKLGDTKLAFRKSLLHALQDLDGQRNAIVHWNAVNDVRISESGETVVRVHLRPPQFVFGVDMASEIGTTALIAFIDKCGFYGRLINIFVLVGLRRYGGGAMDPILDPFDEQWRNVFEERIIYPPPAGHPILG